MTFAPGYVEPVINMVTALGPWGLSFGVSVSPPASASWSGEGASRAVYVPISIPTVCVARRMWWANGGTVSATYNIDAGIYRAASRKPAARLVSTGATAQGTASEVQFADITDTTLTPGLYWLALVCDSTLATFLRVAPTGTTAYDAVFRMEEASAYPLPATATPAESGNASHYLFGFSTTTIT